MVVVTRPNDVRAIIQRVSPLLGRSGPTHPLAQSRLYFLCLLNMPGPKFYLFYTWRWPEGRHRRTHVHAPIASVCCGASACQTSKHTASASKFTALGFGRRCHTDSPARLPTDFRMQHAPDARFLSPECMLKRANALLPPSCGVWLQNVETPPSSKFALLSTFPPAIQKLHIVLYLFFFLLFPIFFSSQRNPQITCWVEGGTRNIGRQPLLQPEECKAKHAYKDKVAPTRETCLGSCT